MRLDGIGYLQEQIQDQLNKETTKTGKIKCNLQIQIVFLEFLCAFIGFPVFCLPFFLGGAASVSPIKKKKQSLKKLEVPLVSINLLLLAQPK